MEEHNVFAGAFVDRKTLKRKDNDWLEKALLQENTRFIPIWDECFLVNETLSKLIFLKSNDFNYSQTKKNNIFLGYFRGHPIFAIIMNENTKTPFSKIGKFKNLRYLGNVIATDEANLAAYICGLVKWHDSQIFCSKCGSLTKPEKGGNSRRCKNSVCDNTIFPRVDPAIIVLVTNGEKCLLGRQAGWPKERYSTIAGFVEPGESLEDAVCREVFEETNIVVCKIEYCSSQPWPFPSSLMLGFTAEVDSTVDQNICLNDQELEHAAWFSRKELLSDFPKLPNKMSIARRLIDTWTTLSNSR